MAPPYKSIVLKWSNVVRHPPWPLLYIRSLECCGVGRRESPISEASVREVAGDQLPHVVQFIFGGLVFSPLLYSPTISPKSLWPPFTNGFRTRKNGGEKMSARLDFLRKLI
jgi:hypothetical protein